jgi:rubrerythrin
MYYHCPECGKKFKNELGLLAEMGESFGVCPVCGVTGCFERDGARIPNDMEYEEVDG